MRSVDRLYIRPCRHPNIDIYNSKPNELDCNWHSVYAYKFVFFPSSLQLEVYLVN